MDLKLSDDDSQIFEALVDKVIAGMMPKLYKHIDDRIDEIQGRDFAMNRQDLTKLLGVSYSKAIIDEQIHRPGFPYYKVGTQDRFWRPAVIEYMTTHQLHH